MSDPARCWMIKRNCSASPQQLACVFASVAGVSFAIGAAFAAQGLWMVLPFVGVETLALAAAFFCYGRRAADYERIAIGEREVSIEQVEGRQRSLTCWPAPWARIEVQRRGSNISVWLASGADRVEVGRHLHDARRTQLAEEMESALRGMVPA